MVPSPQFESWSATVILAWAFDRYGDAVALGTSFQKEGMVVLDIAWRLNPSLRVFTLDTGCLPEETLAMIATVRERYGITVERVQPDEAEVAAMVAAHGADLYYREVPLRALCCQVRKVRPLERKLAGLAAWITGLRREQNSTRSEVPKVETARRHRQNQPRGGLDGRRDRRLHTRSRRPGPPACTHKDSRASAATLARAPSSRGKTRARGAGGGSGRRRRSAEYISLPGERAARRVDVLLAEVLGGKGA